MKSSRKLIGIRVPSRLVGVLSAGISLLLCTLTSAWAQSTSAGSVSGQVTDQQSAAIGDAEVKLIDLATASARTNSTNAAGRFSFANVPPGTYDVTVSKSGFSLSRLAHQTVEVGLLLTVNVTLQVGATSTVVEVQAQAVQLQTANATVGTTITGDSLMLLPNLGRDASTLATLQVGVAPTGAVAGAAADQNTFQLDGGNNSDDMAGTQSTYTPANGYTGSSSTGGSPSGVIPTPVESIEEFKIATTGQTADFNASAGGQIQMVTKRGTNQFHGAVYEYYFASNVGAANLWKNNHTPSNGLPYTPLPSTHRNRYGGALGGPLLPRYWGGKTYFFANYEGFRFPNSTTIEKAVPSELLRAGVIQIPNAAGAYVPYNLNPDPVTVNGTTYQPAMCGGGLCDPRRLGLNPIVNQIWSKYMPHANDSQYIATGSDGINQQGYLTNISLPQKSDFFVARVDHDFGEKWHFMASYRYYRFSQLTANQFDVGGALPGDAFGTAVGQAPRPQKPSYLVGGLTTVLTSHLTNDFHVSYLRNFWQWSTQAAPPQLAGLGGALEIGGEPAGVNALIPYNVNAQSARQRFWDGKDQSYRDDLSLLKGNHLFQFGGLYQRNFDYHQRNDNGVGIMSSVVYQITNGTGISFPSSVLPAGLPANQITNYQNLYAQVLGLVSQPQVLYSRAGSDLQLQKLGTPLSDQSIIPTYNLYFSDTWHLRPNFTLTYGLSYTLELPPYEINGKQVGLLDSTGKLINAADFLAQKQKAALAGQVYEPTIGFATVRNVGKGLKYPYDPFYGGFSPRIAAAWNPNFSDGLLGHVFGRGLSVIRGGYGRVYGRLNGVDLVLVPLLGTGLGQAVSCIGASRTGQCLGTGGVDPSTAFRIGADGLTAPLPGVSQTLSQPYFPGVNGNAAAGDGSVLDPKFRPNHSDQLTFSIQRQFKENLLLEAGYIGRIIKNEYQAINLDAVPYMTTLGGQSFANAFAGIYTQLSAGQAVTPQPFFEAALGGPNSAYCAGAASCTAAVAAKQTSAIKGTQVYNLWSSISSAPSWTLGRTLLASAPAQLSSINMETSLGYGNYNAAYLSLTARNWHGLTARSNFTWSRALGTGSVNQSTSSFTVLDPWNLHASYGPQPFDIRFVYNLVMLYQPAYFKSQRGFLGRLLGGWAIAPIFTAQSGAPLEVNIGTGSNTDAQSFGEVYGNNNTSYENAVLTTKFTGGNSAHNNVSVPSGAGVNGNPARGGSGINMFSDPNAIYGQFRRLILGIDTTGGGAGVIRGFPAWSLDATVSKDIHVTERFGASLIFQFTNVLNHFQPANPSMNIDSPQTWGVVTNQATTGTGGLPAIAPRQMEFGLRIRF